MIGDSRYLLPGRGIPGHNGQTTGYHSYLAWDPERRIGVVVLANAAVDIDDVGIQLMGTGDLFFNNVIFGLTAIAFMLLLSVLLAAQKKRRVKTTWGFGILWLLLAAPLAHLFSRFLAEGRGAMKRQFSTLLHLLILLAVSACGLAKATRRQHPALSIIPALPLARPHGRSRKLFAMGSSGPGSGRHLEPTAGGRLDHASLLH